MQILSKHQQFLINIFKNFGNFTFCVRIWNQHEIWIKMSTNKPMFGLVVLEIARDFHKQDILPLKCVVNVKSPSLLCTFLFIEHSEMYFITDDSFTFRWKQHMLISCLLPIERSLILKNRNGILFQPHDVTR